MKRVAIIGGGISGIACALELLERGIDFRLFESTDRLGGRICDLQVDGLTVPLGASTFSMRHTNLLNLINSLELGRGVRPAAINKSRGIFTGGRLIKLTAFAVLFDGTLAIRTKLDLFRLRRFLSNFSPAALPREVLSLPLKEFILRNYSSQVLEDFVEPSVNAIFGTGASSVSAEAALPRIAAAFHAYELEGGLTRIVTAAEARIAGRVAKNARVTGVELPAGSKPFRVVVGGGKQEFDAVVCCMPIPEVAKVEAEVILPKVTYRRSDVYVVRGENRNPGLSAIVVGDRKFNIDDLRNYGAIARVSSQGGEIDMSPFFKAPQVIHQRTWDYTSVQVVPGASDRSLATNVPNMYLCSEYVYGSGVESQIRAAKEVVQRLSGESSAAPAILGNDSTIPRNSTS